MSERGDGRPSRREEQAILDWRPDTELATEQGRQWQRDSQRQRYNPLEMNKDGTYTVRYPDCLYTIAEKQLGHARGEKPPREVVEVQIGRIIEANRDRYPTLEANPDFIKPGWRLKLPPVEQPRREPEPEPPVRRRPEPERPVREPERLPPEPPRRREEIELPRDRTDCFPRRRPEREEDCCCVPSRRPIVIVIPGGGGCCIETDRPQVRREPYFYPDRDYDRDRYDRERFDRYDRYDRYRDDDRCFYDSRDRRRYCGNDGRNWQSRYHGFDRSRIPAVPPLPRW